MNCVQRFLNRVDGYADHHAVPHLFAHLGRCHILLTYMDPVCLTLNGNFYIVIDKEGNSILLAQSRDFFGFFQKLFLAHFLLTKLHTGYTAL